MRRNVDWEASFKDQGKHNDLGCGKTSKIRRFVKMLCKIDITLEKICKI